MLYFDTLTGEIVDDGAGADDTLNELFPMPDESVVQPSETITDLGGGIDLGGVLGGLLDVEGITGGGGISQPSLYDLLSGGGGMGGTGGYSLRPPISSPPSTDISNLDLTTPPSTTTTPAPGGTARDQLGSRYGIQNWRDLTDAQAIKAMQDQDENDARVNLLKRQAAQVDANIENLRTKVASGTATPQDLQNLARLSGQRGLIANDLDAANRFAQELALRQQELAQRASEFSQTLGLNQQRLAFDEKNARAGHTTDLVTMLTNASGRISPQLIQMAIAAIGGAGGGAGASPVTSPAPATPAPTAAPTAPTMSLATGSKYMQMPMATAPPKPIPDDQLYGYLGSTSTYDYKPSTDKYGRQTWSSPSPYASWETSRTTR